MDQLICCKLPYKVDTGTHVDKRHPFSVIQNTQNRELRERTKVVDNEENDNIASKEDPLIKSRHEKEFEKQECGKPKLSVEKIYADATETVVNFNTNPVLIRDIYFHMKEAESELSQLFRKPTNKISIEMRTVFVDWFVYTAQRFNLHTETLHLAVRYADEYLFKEEFGVEALVLVGTSAVFLACKMEEARDNIPEIDELVEHSKSGYSKFEIFNMEQNMLKALDFKLSYPTSYQFLKMFCDIVNIKEEVSFLAQYLCDVALMYEDICYYTEPSRIAAASIVLSNQLLYNQARRPDIEILSGYNQSDLEITKTLLFTKFDKVQATDFRAVKAKYSTSEYNNVSTKSYQRNPHT